MKIAIQTNMIYCRLKQLIAEKEFREKRKITYKVLQDELGLSSTTIAKLLSYKGVQRIDGSTLDRLCQFFGCQVGDILVYSPDVIATFHYENRGSDRIVPPDEKNWNDIKRDTDNWFSSPREDINEDDNQ